MSSNENVTGPWLAVFLARSSVTDILQYPAQVLLLAFHVALTTFIFVKVVEGNVKFIAAFYKLFLLQSFANYATFGTVCCTLRKKQAFEDRLLARIDAEQVHGSIALS
jgi:hypothetical protein